MRPQVGLSFTRTEPNQPSSGSAFFILLHLTGTLLAALGTLWELQAEICYFSLLHIGEKFFSCHGDNPDSKKYPRHGLFLDKKVQTSLPQDETLVSDMTKACVVDWCCLAAGCGITCWRPWKDSAANPTEPAPCCKPPATSWSSQLQVSQAASPPPGSPITLGCIHRRVITQGQREEQCLNFV